MTEQELKDKRLALLEETANHFNLKNRSTDPEASNRCIYSGVGCAIGRKIADKELCAKLDSKLPKTSGVSNDEVFDQLPDDLQCLGQDYLAWVQQFHDAERNWTETGMSKEGIAYRDHIKDMIETGEFKVDFLKFTE